MLLLVLELMSIIKSNEWPSRLPTISHTSTLIGIGGMQHPKNVPTSGLPLALKGKLHISPFVASIPCTLWGRDVLGPFRTTIKIDSTSIVGLFHRGY